MPPNQTSIFDAAGQHLDVVVVVAITVVAERLPCPAVAHHRQHLVEQLRSFATLHAERLLLDGVDSAEPERREEPAA